MVPAGAATASPYELLQSPRLAELFDEARAQFDYVVVDTPPLIPVPDCRIIGKHVDGFLLVVRAHKTRTKLFDEAARVLDSSKIVGVIFNASDEVSQGRYAAPYAPDGPSEAAPSQGVVWRRRLFGGRSDRRHRHTASR
jgi:Mrp family chromosome partitioning ATPase